MNELNDLELDDISLELELELDLEFDSEMDSEDKKEGTTKEVSIMGRPTWRERDCPKCGCYSCFEKLYVRRGAKMMPVGRKCSKCNHIVLD